MLWPKALPLDLDFGLCAWAKLFNKKAEQLEKPAGNKHDNSRRHGRHAWGTTSKRVRNNESKVRFPPTHQNGPKIAWGTRRHNSHVCFIQISDEMNRKSTVVYHWSEIIYFKKRNKVIKQTWYNTALSKLCTYTEFPNGNLIFFTIKGLKEI